jgi:hypothetical protein
MYWRIGLYTRLAAARRYDVYFSVSKKDKEKRLKEQRKKNTEVR